MQYIICISAASCRDNSCEHCERFLNIPQTDYLASSLLHIFKQAINGIDVYYCELSLSYIMYCITTYLVFIGTRYYMTPATIDYFTIIINE